MKKKVIALVAIAAFTMGMFTFVNTKAVVSPDCPNGCYANGDGCYCNGWYPCYKEAGSKIDQPAEMR